MAKLILGIGVPASGKSTMLKKFAEEYQYTYVCPDDIRQCLTGDTADQSEDERVWQIVHAEVERALRSGRTVVVDATFANEDERKRFLAFGERCGAKKVQGIFLDVPKDVAHKRNAARERMVPPKVIDRMEKQLHDNPPSLKEGFDALFTFDEFQQLLKAEGEYGERPHRKPR